MSMLGERPHGNYPMTMEDVEKLRDIGTREAAEDSAEVIPDVTVS
jgi:hypothetical protein